MVVDERHRHDLHEAARRALGEDAAVTLMEMLPPTGWADVATKRDLDTLDNAHRLELRADLHALETRITRELSKLTWRLAASTLAIIGAVGAFTQL